MEEKYKPDMQEIKEEIKEEEILESDNSDNKDFEEEKV